MFRALIKEHGKTRKPARTQGQTHTRPYTTIHEHLLIIHTQTKNTGRPLCHQPRRHHYCNAHQDERDRASWPVPRTGAFLPANPTFVHPAIESQELRRLMRPRVCLFVCLFYLTFAPISRVCCAPAHAPTGTHKFWRPTFILSAWRTAKFPRRP